MLEDNTLLLGDFIDQKYGRFRSNKSGGQAAVGA
jgi:hypothetical protein